MLCIYKPSINCYTEKNLHLPMMAIEYEIITIDIKSRHHKTLFLFIVNGMKYVWLFASPDINSNKYRAEFDTIIESDQ